MLIIFKDQTSVGRRLFRSKKDFKHDTAIKWVTGNNKFTCTSHGPMPHYHRSQGRHLAPMYHHLYDAARTIITKHWKHISKKDNCGAQLHLEHELQCTTENFYN